MSNSANLNPDDRKLLDFIVHNAQLGRKIGSRDASNILHWHLLKTEEAIRRLEEMGLVIEKYEEFKLVDEHGNEIKIRYFEPTVHAITLVRKISFFDRMNSIEPIWKLIGGILALTTLIIASLNFAGLNTLGILHAPTSAPTQVTIPTAKPGEILTLVAQFDGPDDIQVSSWVWEKLNEEINHANLTNVRIVEIPDIIKNPDQARQVGTAHKATIVIWGSYDKVGVVAHFETIAEHADIRVGRQAYRRQGLSLQQASSDPSSASAIYFTQGLPNELTYFTSFAIGQLYYWNEQYEDALRSFTVSINVIQEDERKEELKGLDAIYFYRGYIYLSIENQPKEAIEDFTEAIILRPNDFKEAYNNRGTAYIDLNDYSNALQDLDRAISIDPNYSSAYNNRGNVYRELGKFDEALKDYDTAVNLNPEDASPYVGRGMVFYLQKDYARASEEYNVAIELDPNNAGAYNNRGVVFGDQGKWVDALSDFNKAIELDSEFALAFNNRGAAYSHLDRTQDALKDFNRALELDPNLELVLTNRANTYRTLGKYEDALSDFSKSIELNSSNANAYAGRAHIYTLLNQNNKAMQDIDVVLQLDPQNALAYFVRGNIYSNAGDYDLAIQDYSTTIQLDSSIIPSAYFNRALAYANTNEKENACADLSAYLDFDLNESDRDFVTQYQQNLGCK